MKWRAALAVPVVPLAMIVTAPAALACSCAMIPFDDHLRGADVVFTGTAVSYADGRTGPVVSSSDQLPWTFAVDRAYRGAVEERQVVVTARDGASCGAEFQVGRTYLVMAAGDPAQANLCNGTHELAGAVPAALGTGTPPTTSPPVTPPPTAPVEQADPPVLLWAVGLGAVIVAAATGLVLRRRRRIGPQTAGTGRDSEFGGGNSRRLMIDLR